MDNAIEQLLKDHKMIKKVLSDFAPAQVRFPDLLKTLRRIVLAHAWFEDEFLMPALKTQPAIFRPFWTEILQEHQDISALLTLLRDSATKPDDVRAYALTLKTLLTTHFAKEEDALFPLAEKVISREGLRDMALAMEKRKAEVRGLGAD